MISSFHSGMWIYWFFLIFTHPSLYNIDLYPSVLIQASSLNILVLLLYCTVYVHTIQYSVRTYSTVQCTYILYSTVYIYILYSTVYTQTLQYSVHILALQYSVHTLQYIVQCTYILYSTVYIYTLKYSLHTYSTVQCTHIHYSTVYIHTLQYSVHTAIVDLLQ